MSMRDIVQIEPVGPRDAAPSQQHAGQTLPGYMDFHVFCRLVDQLPELTDLRLQGRGDPLLHLHILDMVRHAVQRGLLVSMTTSLTALSEAHAVECIDSGLYRIALAVDAAASPLASGGPIHPRLLRVLRNLRRLMFARSQSESLRPQVILRALLDRADLARLPSLVRFAFDEGIEDMTIYCADPDALMPIAEHRAGLAEARALARTLGVGLRLPQQESTPPPARLTSIDCNGLIVQDGSGWMTPAPAPASSRSSGRTDAAHAAGATAE